MKMVGMLEMLFYSVVDIHFNDAYTFCRFATHFTNMLSRACECWSRHGS
jgi:hypothetical protein